MFGLLLKSIPSCAVALCFTIGRAIYNYKVHHRPLGKLLLDAALTSVFHSVGNIIVDKIYPEIDIPIEENEIIRVPLDTIAESTANQLLDNQVSSFLDSYNVSQLPSGISIAKTALVDFSTGYPRYEGIIDPLRNKIESNINSDYPIFTKHIILPEYKLKGHRMKLRILPKKKLN